MPPWSSITCTGARCQLLSLSHSGHRDKAELCRPQEQLRALPEELPLLCPFHLSQPSTPLCARGPGWAQAERWQQHRKQQQQLKGMLKIKTLTCTGVSSSFTSQTQQQLLNLPLLMGGIEKGWLDVLHCRSSIQAWPEF